MPDALVCAGSARQTTLARRAATLGPALQAALRDDSTTATLRAAGLLELATGAGDRVATRRAALRLEEVAFRDPSAVALRDAASAQVISGVAAGDATQLMRALEFIERAMFRDSSDVTVRFNRALILDQVGLAGEAAANWRSLLGVRDLRQEARPRFERQRQRDAQPPGRERLDAAARAGVIPDSLIQRLLADDPVSLREYAMDVSLPAWGRQPNVETPLRLAQRLGAALAGKGDHTVSAAVQLAERYRASPSLSAGLAAYGRGRALFDGGEFEQSAPQFEAALSALESTAGPGLEGVALWGWPAIHLGVYQLYARRYARADSIFTRVVRATGEAPLWTLLGRALWGFALSLARQDSPRQAIERYREAIVRFEGTGESGNVGALEYQLADMYALTGDAGKAASAMVRASRAFHAPRHSGTLLDFLESFAAFELRAGRPHGALAILREAVRVSRRTGRVKDMPESLTLLASAEIQVGSIASARAHLGEARGRLGTVTSELMRLRLDADLRRVEAKIQQGPAAVGELDRAAAYYRNQGIPFSLAPILVQRADARLAMGDTLRGERDLDGAMALVRRRAELLDPLQAASAREVERSVFERRVALLMRQGDATGALAQLDDHRTWHKGPSGPVTRITGRLDRDEAIVAYAALPEQLVIWTLTDGGITSRVTPAAAHELIRRAARHEALLGAGGDREALTLESEELYRLLLEPVDTLLRGKRRLGIVADPALAGIPFAALRSRSSGRYLIEDFTLHHGFGVWDALAGFASTNVTSGGTIQVVGNPAFDRSQDPALQPLRYAAAEADSVAAVHPASQRLDGGRATPRSVVAALSRASLFHFAGHARGAASGLQGSRLLLAPETPDRDGDLTAEHIAGLRLPQLRLVILSACETLGRNQPAAYRFDGLAEAFLAAGAGGVIGSLWAVDDAGIIRLMTRLNRGLAGGHPPAEALRLAQLAALHEPGVPVRTWAAFRYLTR